MHPLYVSHEIPRMTLLTFEIVAMTSLRAARLGISGVVLIALFLVLVQCLIWATARHESEPLSPGAIGYGFITLIVGWIAAWFGDGLSQLASVFSLCGAAALIASGPLLELRWLHRAIVALTTPLLFILCSLTGAMTEKWFIENALK